MKRKQLVHTAHDLFFKYGIKRVTVEEICKEANVSKMTFYKHFKNKNELVKTMVTDLVEEGMEKYRNLMDSDLPFEDKIRETIQMKLDGTDGMSSEFLADYIQHAEPDFLEFLHGKMNEAMTTVIRDYAEAQKKGDIRQDIRIEFIMWYLNKMMELMGDEQLEMLYDNPQEMIGEMVNFFFYGIMPRK